MKTCCSLDIICCCFHREQERFFFSFLRKGNGKEMISHEQITHKKMLLLSYRHDKYAPFHY